MTGDIVLGKVAYGGGSLTLCISKIMSLKEKASGKFKTAFASDEFCNASQQEHYKNNKNITSDC